MELSNNINEWNQGRIGLDYFLTHNSRKRTFLFSVSSDQFYSTLGIWEEYIVTSLILSWFRCGIIARVELCNNTWCLLSIEIHRLQIYTFSEQRHKYKLTTDTNLRLAFQWFWTWSYCLNIRFQNVFVFEAQILHHIRKLLINLQIHYW